MPATPYAALLEAHNAARACAVAPPFFMQNTRNVLWRFARLAFAFVAHALVNAFRNLRRRG